MQYNNNNMSRSVLFVKQGLTIWSTKWLLFYQRSKYHLMKQYYVIFLKT